MNPTPFDWLLAQWHELLGPFHVPVELCESAFDQICRDYYSLGRYYHTLDHIADVLKTVSQLIDLATDPVAVRVAAWYHDCIYDSRASDNEECSAEAGRFFGRPPTFSAVIERDYLTPWPAEVAEERYLKRLDRLVRE